MDDKLVTRSIFAMIDERYMDNDFIIIGSKACSNGCGDLRGFILK